MRSSPHGWGPGNLSRWEKKVCALRKYGMLHGIGPEADRGERVTRRGEQQEWSSDAEPEVTQEDSSGGVQGLLTTRE